MCDPCAVCCCCIQHYESVQAPDIGEDLIDSHDATAFKMIGDTMPLVEVTIPPQQTMIGEPGAMCFMEDGIVLESGFDDGSGVDEPGCCKKFGMSCARCCSGESFSVAHFTNESGKDRKLGFGNDTPGHIVPVNLEDVEDNILFTMNGSFLMAAKGTRVDVVRTDCCQCCCGAGLCFQKIDGNGMVFLSGGGTVVRQDLEEQEHRIDSQSLLAFTKGLKVDVRRTGRCCTMCCGGEGFAMTTIAGTGSYWLASAPNQTQINYALQFLPPKD